MSETIVNIHAAKTQLSQLVARTQNGYVRAPGDEHSVAIERCDEPELIRTEPRSALEGERAHLKVFTGTPHV